MNIRELKMENNFDKAELLDKAITLALSDIVEQMESGEYLSAGQLSFLNSLAKTSGIKPVEVTKSMDLEFGKKLRGLIDTAEKKKSNHYKEA
jgi:hypothetical protein